MNCGVLALVMHMSCIDRYMQVHRGLSIMFKAIIAKVTCGAALLIGFVACSAGSEEFSEDLAAGGETEALEASSGDTSAASLQVDRESEATSTGANASAEVEASGLVCTDCYVSLPPCFEDRDAIFEETGILCVCQPPDLDQCCASNQVDLECNL